MIINDIIDYLNQNNNKNKNNRNTENTDSGQKQNMNRSFCYFFLVPSFSLENRNSAAIERRLSIHLSNKRKKNTKSLSGANTKDTRFRGEHIKKGCRFNSSGYEL